MIKKCLVGIIVSIVIICSMTSTQIAFADNNYYMYTPAGFAILCNPGSSAYPPYPYVQYGDSFIVVDINSALFNCHTFAWFYEGNTNAYLVESQFNIQDPSGYYDPYPLIYNETTCYDAIYEGANYFTDEIASNLYRGDIIVYYIDTNPYTNGGSILWDGVNPYRHSAVVVSENNTHNTVLDVRVISKWKHGPIVNSDLVHHPEYFADCDNNPYNALTVTNYHGDHIYVYRHNSNHAATHLLSYTSSTHTYCCYYCGRGVITENHSASSYTINPLVHSGICSDCGMSFQEPHNFIYYGNKYHCTICGYATNHPVYPNAFDEEVSA